MSTFQYVLIPANTSALPITKTGSTAGGLEKDELVQNAKEYFFQQSDASKHVKALKNASPEQRTELAEQFKKQPSNANNPHLHKLSNEQILQLLESTHATPSCEIIALTIPTRGNGYQAVSMYISQFTDGMSLNKTASGIVLACGHGLPEAAGQKQPGIYGDVFVGRAKDDEAGDEWKRLDFTPDDLLPNSSWIQVARTPGGGGGTGGGSSAAAPSLSGSVMQQLRLGGDETENATLAETTPMIEEEEDLGYTWDQTDDEVEVKFKCDASTKGKDVQVQFARTSLKVQVKGETLVDGKTGGSVVVDDCTYTLQDEGTGRELCIVLGKLETGLLWGRPVVAR